MTPAERFAQWLKEDEERMNDAPENIEEVEVIEKEQTYQPKLF